MADYTAKRIGDMEAIFRGAFRKARAELGVTSFGLQVVEMPAHAHRYPEHDHSGDGQEEVFLALGGSGELEVDGERVALDTETLVRVGPEAKRKVITAEEPLRLLIIGATPGRPYEVKQFTELGEPDPMA